MIAANFYLEGKDQNYKSAIAFVLKGEKLTEKLSDLTEAKVFKIIFLEMKWKMLLFEEKLEEALMTMKRC